MAVEQHEMVFINIRLLQLLLFSASMISFWVLMQQMLMTANYGIFQWVNLCPKISPQLLGPIPINFGTKDILPNSSLYGNKLQLGGYWKPTCIARKTVAILVPYRNRPEQLKVFLNHMHPILQRQQLSYRIFVVEQAGKVSFNKGAIYNIGFNESTKFGDFECYIFHDIDLLCENDHNYYGCPSSPMHMSPAIDKFNYRLFYPSLVGGIQAIKKSDYIKINGYSNSFYGWGGEDDNLFQRFTAKRLKLTRPSMLVGRYKMNKQHHYRSDGQNPVNLILLNKHRPRISLDGINTIKLLRYNVNVTLEPLYTLISVNLLR